MEEGNSNQQGEGMLGEDQQQQYNILLNDATAIGAQFNLNNIMRGEGAGDLKHDGDAPATLAGGIVGHSWSGRMWLLGLPGVSTLFWFLATVPVQLVCECVRLRLSQMPSQPSQLSIRQVSADSLWRQWVRGRGRLYRT